MRIKIGGMIRDNHGRIGVAIEKTEEPDTVWAKVQSAERNSGLADSDWWKGLVLSGGHITHPQTPCWLQEYVIVVRIIQTGSLPGSRISCHLGIDRFISKKPVECSMALHDNAIDAISFRYGRQVDALAANTQAIVERHLGVCIGTKSN